MERGERKGDGVPGVRAGQASGTARSAAWRPNWKRRNAQGPSQGVPWLGGTRVDKAGAHAQSSNC